MNKREISENHKGLNIYTGTISMKGEICCIANQDCTADGSLEPPKAAKGTCFKCGQKVCTQCSQRIKYMNYGRVRICDSCLDEIRGDEFASVKKYLKRYGYLSTDSYYQWLTRPYI
jgi:hypothetical protein